MPASDTSPIMPKISFSKTTLKERGTDLPKSSFPYCFYDAVSSELLKGDYWSVHRSFSVVFSDSNLKATVPLGFMADRNKLPFWLKTLVPIWKGVGSASMLFAYLQEIQRVRDPKTGVYVYLGRKDIHKAVLAVLDTHADFPKLSRFILALDFTVRQLFKSTYKVSVNPEKVGCEIANELKLSKQNQKG